MIVRLRETYQVVDAPIVLDVAIGEGQKAFVEAFLGENSIGRGQSITGLGIGTGSTVTGQTLRVEATVADSNEQTNRTDVTYTLRGGKSDQVFRSSHDVESDGDTVIYDAAFVLL